MRIFKTCLALTMLTATAMIGCGPTDNSQPEPPKTVAKVFFGNLFARDTGKSANLNFNVTINTGDAGPADLPLTMNVSGRVANDVCDGMNRGWNSDITVSATTTGYGLTGKVHQHTCTEGSSSSTPVTLLTMNLAIDGATTADAGPSGAEITGAFPPGSGNDIVVADLTISGTEPNVTIMGRLRLNDGDAPVEIVVGADGIVEGYVGFPENAVDINGKIDLDVLGQLPAQTIAASLLAQAIVMNRY